MHLQHADMFVVVQDFLALFLKHKHIPDSSVKKLKMLLVDSTELQLCNKTICVGQHAYAVLDQSAILTKNSHWLSKLYQKLCSGYVKAADMLIKKLPA